MLLADLRIDPIIHSGKKNPEKMLQICALLKNRLVGSYAKNCLGHIGFGERGSVSNFSNGTLFVHSTNNEL